MKLSGNDHIQVENYVTNEHSQMRVIDVFAYHGRFIVYGELAVRSVWIPNRAEGKPTQPARPSCFVVLPDASNDEIAKFVDAIRGLPLKGE